MRASTRRIWLCADDYGIAPGVNRGIRQLILNGRPTTSASFAST
jgi:predicted glycoside hydrolase/deacetylase ChbG (UPF0249 family)